MKRWLAGWRLRSRNTIARWIALTTIVAMLTALAFNALFTQLAGVWAYPPLSEIGLLERTALTTHMIEAAPPELRAHLAATASNAKSTVSWHATHQEMHLPVLHDDLRPLLNIMLMFCLTN